MIGCVCKCLRIILSWEVGEIRSPNVKFLENGNHSLWNHVLNWGNPHPSLREVLVSHTCSLPVNLLFQGNPVRMLSLLC